MYSISFTTKARKQIRSLSKQTLKKLEKQLSLLSENLRHPSLMSQKMGGYNKWEARIDYHYRFTFVIDENHITLLTVGMHDSGLGKK